MPAIPSISILSASAFAGRVTALCHWATGCLLNTSIPARLRTFARRLILLSVIWKGDGIDVSKKIVAAGPSAGAHLTSIMCYCRKVQGKYNVDVSNIIGFIGSGGPYSFRDDQSLALKLLLDQLFRKNYNRKNGEPVALMGKSRIPMLLIQSRHDGLVEYACAEDFARRAEELGNTCELYSVTDKKNTHSWYTAGMFMETREENRGAR